MTERKYFLVRLERTSGWSPYVTQAEVASHVDVHPELIDRFVCLGLIDPVGRDSRNERIFHVDVIPVVRKIIRLRNQLGVNYAGIGVILDLMKRVEMLEAQLRELEDRTFL